MAEQAQRTYSSTVGWLEVGLAGFWVVLGLLNTLSGDRLFAVFCLVSALASGLTAANYLRWRGTNRWFKPAMIAVAAVMAVFAVFFIARLFGGWPSAPR